MYFLCNRSARVQEKFEAFAHEEYNNDEFKDTSRIKKCIENVDYVGGLYNSNGTWNDFGTIYNPPNTLQFKFMQLIDAIPACWKLKIAQNRNAFMETNNINRNQHILFLTRQLGLENLTSKQMYIMLLTLLVPSFFSCGIPKGVDFQHPLVKSPKMQSL